MAEQNTFTVDTTPQTETVISNDGSTEGLTPDEQDSLAVGEEITAQQENLLAGKYKNAQELENAYIELEKKLGEKSAPDSQEQSSEEPETEAKTDTDEKPESPDGYAFLEDLYEQASSEKGEISKDMMDKLSSMSKQDIIQNFLQFRADAESKYQAIPDLSQQDVKELKGLVGGDQNYANMLQWAQTNLTEQEIGMFDAVMQNGDINSAFFAVNSLAQRYNDRVGYDGKMLTGNAPSNKGDTYRSQAEMVAAMSDPKYDKDPAYRRDRAGSPPLPNPHQVA